MSGWIGGWLNGWMYNCCMSRWKDQEAGSSLLTDTLIITPGEEEHEGSSSRLPDSSLNEE